MKNYVDDMIGDDYKDWRNSENVLISSPTGSGKTHFILNTLLPFAKAENRTILYACNRKVLCKQIENMVPEEYKDYIGIYTYQALEYKLKELRSYSYHIFDEAHYFFQDSIFNRRTARWYPVLYEEHLSPSYARIFISATPEDLRMLYMPLSIDRYKEFFFSCHEGTITEALIRDTCMPGTFNLNLCTQYSYGDYYCDKINSLNGHVMKEYSMKKTYDYVTCNYFKYYDELTERICESNDKWMIFVNKKRDGESYCKKLKEAFEGTKKTVIFVSRELANK